jgi:hypothetical protein
MGSMVKAHLKAKLNKHKTSTTKKAKMGQNSLRKLDIKWRSNIREV